MGRVLGLLLGLVSLASGPSVWALSTDFVCRTTDGSIVVSNVDLSTEAIGRESSPRVSLQFTATEFVSGFPERGELVYENSNAEKAFVRIITVRSESLLSEVVQECGINQPQYRGPVTEVFEKVADVEVRIGKGEYQRQVLVCEETRNYGGLCEFPEGRHF